MHLSTSLYTAELLHTRDMIPESYARSTDTRCVLRLSVRQNLLDTHGFVKSVRLQEFRKTLQIDIFDIYRIYTCMINPRKACSMHL